MNIQANMLDKATTNLCLLDLEYGQFIELLELSLELLLC